MNNFIFDRHYYGISNMLTVPDAPTFLLGDVDLSGRVDFADIPPFIALLQEGEFQDEADIDRCGKLDFNDIPAFIALLLAQ